MFIIGPVNVTPPNDVKMKVKRITEPVHKVNPIQKYNPNDPRYRNQDYFEFSGNNPETEELGVIYTKEGKIKGR